MKNYLVYLAGPISGINLEGGSGWREYVIENLYDQIQGLSPLRNKEYLKNEGDLDGSYEEWPLSNQRGIYSRDRFDCHRADIVLVNFLGAKSVSIGSCMEVAWAAQNNTPVILIMEPGNVHEHPMILEASPFVVQDIDSAIDLIHALLAIKDE